MLSPLAQDQGSICPKSSGGGGQRHDETYRKQRSVIYRQDDVGGRARVTTDEERVLRGH